MTIQNTSLGFVSVYRSLLDHALFSQHPPEYFKIWIYFLLKAAWKPRRWWDGTTEREIPVGGFIGSFDSIAASCKVSRSVARRAVDVFKQCAMIDTQATNKYTLYVVLNYEAYQSQREDTEQEASREAHANSTQSARETHADDTQDARETHADDTQDARKRHQTIINTLTINQKESIVEPSVRRGRDILFEQFWSTVWAKIGKGAAKKAWYQKITSRDLALHVIEQARAQGPRLLREAADGQRTPLHPATWIRQERWTDEPPTLPPARTRESDYQINWATNPDEVS